MTVVSLNPEIEPQAVTELPLPTLATSWRGNPLEHLTRFEPGDAIRAKDHSNGLEPGLDYEVLGYWLRKDKDKNGEEITHMYAYLHGTANGHHKCLRSAVEEERTHEEVLFCQLPTQITELCIQDCLKSNVRHRRPEDYKCLEYVSALDREVIMRLEFGGQHDRWGGEHDHGQYFLPFVA